MIKGRFTVEKSARGDKELEILIKLLAPMLESQGSRIKVKEDDSRLYTHVYVDLYKAEPADKEFL